MKNKIRVQRNQEKSSNILKLRHFILAKVNVPVAERVPVAAHHGSYSNLLRKPRSMARI